MNDWNQNQHQQKMRRMFHTFINIITDSWRHTLDSIYQFHISWTSQVGFSLPQWWLKCPCHNGSKALAKMVPMPLPQRLQCRAMMVPMPLPQQIKALAMMVPMPLPQRFQCRAMMVPMPLPQWLQWPCHDSSSGLTMQTNPGQATSLT